MRRVLLAVCSMALAVSSFAAPPSEASVRRLMEVSEAHDATAVGSEQIEALVREMVRKTAGATSLSDQQSRAVDKMIAEVAQVLREELAWEKLEPIFLPIYTEVYDQEEVDGMIAFYETEIGRAMARKQPQLQARVMRATTDMQVIVMPKIVAVISRHAESLEKVE